MSTLLSARDLTKAFPANVLFEKVSIHVETRDRIGMIGPNGAGKSTLLRILAGLEDADDGEITRRKQLRVTYLEQNDRFPPGATPASTVIAELASPPIDPVEAETRAAIALSKMGFTEFEQPVETLSGGWRKRLSLARALVHEPDLLMLDEPTNHLDLEGVLWLESFVRQTSLAVMYVTHDRTFLENTAKRIIELSPAYPGGTFKSQGNYTEFLRRKEDFLEAQAQQESALANTVRRDTAWLRQGIQGRQTRNKTQVEAAATRRVQLKQTRDRNLAPSRTTTIDFQATERKTKKLLALHAVTKSMGQRTLFRGLDLLLTPGQRLGLLGVNGAGKTTLLRLMNGELEPDRGSIKPAAALRLITLSQHRETLVGEQTLQEALCPVGDMVDYRGKQVHVTGWARRFLFEPDQLATKVKHLSGGEQARLLIANLMLEPADVLLLDEPTNDLDIPSLEVLEDALLEFPGALVLVTHDRFMLERIATEYVGLDGTGNAKSYQTYEAWLKSARTAVDTVEADRPVRVRSTPPTKARTRTLSNKERYEYQGIEAAILAAEAQVETFKAQTVDPTILADHRRAAESFAALAAAEQEVSRLYSRWEELDAIASGRENDAEVK